MSSLVNNSPTSEPNLNTKWWESAISSNSWSADKNQKPLVLIQKLDDKKLLSVSAAGQIQLVNATNLKVVKLCDVKAGFNVAAVNDQGLLALAYPAQIHVYDLKFCKDLFSLTRISTRINAMQFHPDQTSLIMAGLDSRIYRWHFAEDDSSYGVKRQALALERYFGHSSNITDLALHYDGRVFFSGDSSGLVFAWRYFDSDRYKGEYDKNNQFGLRGYSERANRSAYSVESKTGIAKLKLSETGRYLIAATQAGFIEVRKVRGFKQLANIEAHRGLIYSVSILQEEPLRIATLGRDNLLKVWELQNNSKLAVQNQLVNISQDRAENVRELIVLDNQQIVQVGTNGQLSLYVAGGNVHE